MTRTELYNKIDNGGYDAPQGLTYSNSLSYSAIKEAEFENDLADTFGLANHPKRDKVFALAWRYGNHWSYGETLKYYDDLANLIK